ncbi:hypothetical protein E2C01_042875 [Portunus trituberculatus]|uniref:Uncharacterized protein n=1 Tax=Portunus trituberculatus TaxID=210409 RepID=A0A5B7FNQ2_PORTR|nr:hypothetical protein [Portunus trituberculatus]
MITLTVGKQFVSQHKDWDFGKCRTILWSDEASFQITDNQRKRVYRRPGSNRHDPRYTTHTLKPRFFDGVGGCHRYRTFRSDQHCRRSRGDMVETFRMMNGVYDKDVCEGLFKMQEGLQTHDHGKKIFK